MEKHSLSYRLPVICSPMFIVSDYKSVIQQCLSGVIGTFPTLNARPEDQLSVWCEKIDTARNDFKKNNPDAIVAPYGVNLILHNTNLRLEHDFRVIAEHKVPLVITSLRAPDDIVSEVHRWGGLVFHDVISLRHAEKAAAAGVDGLILVCSGAGGHTGNLNPFAFLAEVRQWFKGIIVLAGAISSGYDILAARVMGADFAYMGTRFIATQDMNVPQLYKDQILSSTTADIINSSHLTGVSANYLKKSIEAAGLDINQLDSLQKKFGFSSHADKTAPESLEEKKAWRDIWSAGHGVGAISDLPTISELVDRLCQQYEEAKLAIPGF